MVKVIGNLNRWVTKEYIQEMLGWNPENIDLLINGLSKSVAVTPNNLILINLNDLRNYLVSVKKMADLILEGSASKKIRQPRDVSETTAPKTASERIKKPKIERMNREQRVAAGQLTGKQVAEILKCRYSDIPEFIEKYGLKAGKFGRGYYIKPEDLEEFLSDNEYVVKSLQLPQKQAVAKEPEKTPEAPEKEEKRTETMIQKEKEKEDPKDDLIMPSFPGLPDQASEGEKSKEEDPPKDPIESQAPAEENTESGNDQPPEKDQTSEEQEPVQAEDAEKESIEAGSDPPAEERILKKQETVPEVEPAEASVEENKKEPEILSYVTIKKCRYGCKIDDVASSLKLSIKTPMKWIDNNAVRAVSIPGPRGEDLYIKPESLRDFLMRERNTLVTFSETNIPNHPVGPMSVSDR